MQELYSDRAFDSSVRRESRMIGQEPCSSPEKIQKKLIIHSLKTKQNQANTHGFPSRGRKYETILRTRPVSMENPISSQGKFSQISAPQNNFWKPEANSGRSRVYRRDRNFATKAFRTVTPINIIQPCWDMNLADGGIGRLKWGNRLNQVFVTSVRCTEMS